MTTPSIRQLLRESGIHPKQSLAQNFLADETHLAAIAAAANLTADDAVLEIGPGLGVLTRHLAEQAGRVVAVELDDRLLDMLRDRFADQPHVKFIHADILDVDPAELIAQPTDAKHESTHHASRITPYKVVANLPYYITSAVLRHLLEAAQSPTVAVLLVQREVAERIVEQPGNLSILAVSVQFYAEPQIVHHIPASAFYPVPKVDSAVLRLDVLPQPRFADIATREAAQDFFRIVRAGFGQKRKQLLNSLSAGLGQPKPQITAALARAGIEPKRRAQTLTLDEWAALYRAVELG